MKIELTFTDDEIAAIELAREAANIAAGSIVHADAAAYVQFVMRGAVPYTPLTLPTIHFVEISVAAVSL